jgi:hypothetical protein
MSGAGRGAGSALADVGGGVGSEDAVDTEPLAVAFVASVDARARAGAGAGTAAAAPLNASLRTSRESALAAGAATLRAAATRATAFATVMVSAFVLASATNGFASGGAERNGDDCGSSREGVATCSRDSCTLASRTELRSRASHVVVVMPNTAAAASPT